MWSDNATNFVAGNKELITQFETTIGQVRSEIENLLANDRTTWHHIPASAPNFGGLWEASVKLIKFHLKRVPGNTILTYEEMSSLPKLKPASTWDRYHISVMRPIGYYIIDTGTLSNWRISNHHSERDLHKDFYKTFGQDGQENT